MIPLLTPLKSRWTVPLSPVLNPVASLKTLPLKKNFLLEQRGPAGFLSLTSALQLYCLGAFFWALHNIDSLKITFTAVTTICQETQHKLKRRRDAFLKGYGIEFFHLFMQITSFRGTLNVAVNRTYNPTHILV